MCINGSTNAFYAYLILKHDIKNVQIIISGFIFSTTASCTSKFIYCFIYYSTTVIAEIRDSFIHSFRVRDMPRTLFSSMLHVGRNISILWSCVMSCIITKGFCYIVCFSFKVISKSSITKDENVCQNEKRFCRKEYKKRQRISILLVITILYIYGATFYLHLQQDREVETTSKPVY